MRNQGNEKRGLCKITRNSGFFNFSNIELYQDSRRILFGYFFAKHYMAKFGF
jgi:hypothetical protein